MFVFSVFPSALFSLDIACTTGANPYTGLSVLHTPHSSSTQFEDTLNLALADPTISVVSISYVADEDETDVSSINTLFVQLGSVGVSVFVAAGDTGPFVTRNQTTQCQAFAPRFPASSPWVTVRDTETQRRMRTSKSYSPFSCPHSLILVGVLCCVFPLARLWAAPC